MFSDAVLIREMAFWVVALADKKTGAAWQAATRSDPAIIEKHAKIHGRVRFESTPNCNAGSSDKE